MNARRHLVFQSEPYGQDRLEVLQRAFDTAWQTIDGNFADAPAQVERAQMVLANVILNMPISEIHHATQIARSALAVVALGGWSHPDQDAVRRRATPFSAGTIRDGAQGRSRRIRQKLAQQRDLPNFWDL